MKFLATAAFCCFFGLASAQDGSGIFLSIKCGRGMPQQNVVLTNKSICLAQLPIVMPSEFMSVGDVKQNGETVYFDLLLSDSAYKRLSGLAENLPSTSFALVVDKQVFSVFPASTQVNKTFRFQGTIKDQFIFFSIQEKLRDLIKRT